MWVEAGKGGEGPVEAGRAGVGKYSNRECTERDQIMHLTYLTKGGYSCCQM